MDNDKGMTGIHRRSELYIRFFYDCLFQDPVDYCVIIGSLWSLVGAMLYAVYIVMIKRQVDREDKLDIPMFFGEGTLSIYIYYKCKAAVLLAVLRPAYLVLGSMANRRFPLFRVCRPVQPAVAVARLPPAPLHRLRGL